MDDGGSGQASPRSLNGAAARLGASLLGLVRTRLELASVEFSEQRDRVQQQLIKLVAAMAMFGFAVLFAATWIIVYFWDTNRLTAIALVALAFAVVGGVLLVMRARAAEAAPTPFAATIAEFERDRAALAGRDGAGTAEPPSP